MSPAHKASSQWRSGFLLYEGWPAQEGGTDSHAHVQRTTYDLLSPSMVVAEAPVTAPARASATRPWTDRYPAWWTETTPHSSEERAAASPPADTPVTAPSLHLLAEVPPPTTTPSTSARAVATVEQQTQTQPQSTASQAAPVRSPFMPCMRQPQRRKPAAAPAVSRVGTTLRREAALRKSLAAARRRRLEAVIGGVDPADAPIATPPSLEAEGGLRSAQEEADAAITIAQRFLSSSLGGHFLAAAAGGQPRGFPLHEAEEEAAGTSVLPGAGYMPSVDAYEPPDREASYGAYDVSSSASPADGNPPPMAWPCSSSYGLHRPGPRSLRAVEAAVARLGLHEPYDPVDVLYGASLPPLSSFETEAAEQQAAEAAEAAEAAVAAEAAEAAESEGNAERFQHERHSERRSECHPEGQEVYQEEVYLASVSMAGLARPAAPSACIDRLEASSAHLHAYARTDRPAAPSACIDRLEALQSLSVPSTSDRAPQAWEVDVASLRGGPSVKEAEMERRREREAEKQRRQAERWPRPASHTGLRPSPAPGLAPRRSHAGWVGDYSDRPACRTTTTRPAAMGAHIHTMGAHIHTRPAAMGGAHSADAMGAASEQPRGPWGDEQMGEKQGGWRSRGHAEGLRAREPVDENVGAPGTQPSPAGWWDCPLPLDEPTRATPRC